MDHYSATKNIADGLHKAFEDQENLKRMTEALKRDPRASLTALIQPDGPTRTQLEAQADESFRFIGAILARSMEETAPALRKFESSPASDLRTSAVLSMASQVTTWLDHDVSSESLSGTPKEIFDALYLCFLALRDVEDKAFDVADAAFKLAACEADKLLDPTKDCSAERSHYNAVLHAYDVAVFNLPKAC